MVNRQLKKDVELEINYKPFPFWGFTIAITSMLYAGFHLLHDGLLYGMFEEKFRMIPEDLISWVLFSFGAIKVLGVVLEKYVLMRVGIVGLSGVWGVLMLLSTTYAFGTGYPTARFITTGFIVVACLRVSFKGDFG